MSTDNTGAPQQPSGADRPDQHADSTPARAEGHDAATPSRADDSRAEQPTQRPTGVGPAPCARGADGVGGAHRAPFWTSGSICSAASCSPSLTLFFPKIAEAENSSRNRCQISIDPER